MLELKSTCNAHSIELWANDTVVNFYGPIIAKELEIPDADLWADISMIDLSVQMSRSIVRATPRGLDLLARGLHNNPQTIPIVGQLLGAEIGAILLTGHSYGLSLKIHKESKLRKDTTIFLRGDEIPAEARLAKTINFNWTVSTHEDFIYPSMPFYHLYPGGKILTVTIHGQEKRPDMYYGPNIPIDIAPEQVGDNAWFFDFREGIVPPGRRKTILDADSISNIHIGPLAGYAQHPIGVIVQKAWAILQK